MTFFNSLQSRADILKADAVSLDTLLNAVTAAYNAYDPDTLTQIDALQYQVYRQITSDEGGNGFQIAHSGLRTCQENGQDVVDYSVNRNTYFRCQQHLEN